MNLVYRRQKYFSPIGERFREFAKSYGARHLDSPPEISGGARQARPEALARKGQAGGRRRS
jgi:hypothetical protein